MELYFIRHAQSVNNALWARPDSEQDHVDDPEITDLGFKQARALADHLKNGAPKIYQPPGAVQPKGYGLTHLYASLMERAVQTGTVVAEALDMPLHAWEVIHECGGIHLEDPVSRELICGPGRSREYFQQHYPALVLEETTHPPGWWNHRPVETAPQWEARARQFYAELLKRHGGTDDVVGIISHGGFYMEFARVALHLPPPNGLWLTMYNTGISLFKLGESKDRVNLIFHNRVDHLCLEWIT